MNQSGYAVREEYVVKVLEEGEVSRIIHEAPQNDSPIACCGIFGEESSIVGIIGVNHDMGGVGNPFTTNNKKITSFHRSDYSMGAGERNL